MQKSAWLISNVTDISNIARARDTCNNVPISCT
jgi:hypothetical protein